MADHSTQSRLSVQDLCTIGHINAFNGSKRSLMQDIFDFAKESYYCPNLKDVISMALNLHRHGFTVIIVKPLIDPLGLHRLDFNHEQWTPEVIITFRTHSFPTVHLNADPWRLALPFSVKSHGVDITFNSAKEVKETFWRLIKGTFLALCHVQHSLGM